MDSRFAGSAATIGGGSAAGEAGAGGSGLGAASGARRLAEDDGCLELTPFLLGVLLEVFVVLPAPVETGRAGVPAEGRVCLEL